MEMNKACKSKRSRRPPGVGMKVVYISTPMKVKTCASKFRAIVQELTGRESDVVGIMDSNGGTDDHTWMVSDHHHHHHHHDHHHDNHHHHHHHRHDQLENQDRRRLNPLSSDEFIHDFGAAFDSSLSSSFLYDQFYHQLA